MNEQAHKVFDLKEQKAQDVLAAIKTIVPVISLTKKVGEIEKKIATIESDAEKLQSNISTLKISRDIISDESTKAAIETVISSETEKLATLTESKQRLHKEYSEINKEIENYQEYVKLFKWADTGVMRTVFTLNSFDNDDEFNAMLFFVFNKNGGKTRPFKDILLVEEIFGKTRNYISSLVTDAWNRMQKYFKE